MTCTLWRPLLRFDHASIFANALPSAIGQQSAG